MSEKSTERKDDDNSCGGEIIFSDYLRLSEDSKGRIVSILKGEDFEARFQVTCQIEMGFKTIPSKDSNILVQLLAKDEDPRIRQVSLDICESNINELKRGVIDKVLSWLAEDPETGIRAKVALWLMVNIKTLSPKVRTLLEDLADDESITVRNQVTEGLKQYWEAVPSKSRETILVGLLIDDNQLIRKSAGTILVSNFDSISSELQREFIGSISKEDKSIKAGVAEFLERDGEISDKALSQLLPNLLFEKDEGIEGALVNYLVHLIKIGTKKNLSELLKMVVDQKEQDLLLAIATKLVNDGISPNGKLQEQILVPLLASEDPAIRAGVAKVFIGGYNFLDTDIVKDALNKLVEDGDVNVRHSLATEVKSYFEELPKSTRERLAIELACDHELWVRSRAIDILFLEEALSSGDLFTIIKELAQDPDARVRRGVADQFSMMFEEIYKPFRDELIALMVSDGDVWVRSKAAEMLANYFSRIPEEIGDNLLRFAQDPNPFLRGKTAVAIISNFVSLPFDIQNEILFLASDTEADVLNEIIDAVSENFVGLPEKIRGELFETFLSNEQEWVKVRFIDLFMANIESIPSQRINEVLGELIGDKSQKVLENMLSSLKERFNDLPAEPRILIVGLLKRSLDENSLKIALIEVLIANFEWISKKEQDILREYCEDPDPDLGRALNDLLKGDINEMAVDAILSWTTDQEREQKRLDQEFEDFEI